MSSVSSYANAAESAASYNNSKVKEQTDKVSDSKKSQKVSGKTVGNPKLSEKAAKYYEQLKSKYSNMDFILVSEDKKEAAKAQAASYANNTKMVVLIDEDKIERMAEDEDYRKQYEGIISNAAGGISQLKTSLENAGADVKGYGIQVDDNGTASYFAVLKKSSSDQKARIEKKQEKQKAEKKAEKKKAQKEEQEERLHTKKSDHSEKTKTDWEETVTITGASIDELMKKVSDYMQNEKLDAVVTEQEKMIGQHFDAKW